LFPGRGPGCLEPGVWGADGRGPGVGFGPGLALSPPLVDSSAAAGSAGAAGPAAGAVGSAGVVGLAGTGVVAESSAPRFGVGPGFGPGFGAGFGAAASSTIPVAAGACPSPSGLLSATLPVSPVSLVSRTSTSAVGAVEGVSSSTVDFLAADVFFAGAFLAGGSFSYASLSRRTTGASTVEDADLTYSPRSPSLPRTSLLVTPSSF